MIPPGGLAEPGPVPPTVRPPATPVKVGRTGVAADAARLRSPQFVPHDLQSTGSADARSGYFPQEPFPQEDLASSCLSPHDPLPQEPLLQLPLAV